MAFATPGLCHAQADSLIIAPIKRHSFLTQSIIPTTLIGAGILINRTRFEKTVNKETEGLFRKDFHTTADDYMRYAPIAEMYIADLAGVKAKNHWFDQTKNLAISVVVTDFIVHQIKKATQKTRPNGAELAHSFPSAHSALAFTNATVLFEEFRDSSPLLAYSGYGFATATGTLRLLNNAHWMSDVLMGAGIGILVTKVVYLLDPIIAWNPFKNKSDIVILPQIDNQSYGLYFCKRF
ncbi:MAG: phosphatase PAP2 family protein [Bacteroidota bacterium]